MKKNRSLPEDVIQQAIAWHTQAQQASFDRKEELLSWLRASRDHAVAMDYVAAIWESVPEAAKAMPESRPASTGRRWNPWLRATVALASCAALAGIWWTAGSISQRYESRHGEILTLTLPDETRVTLAPSSQLEVRFSRLARRLTLLSGDADINVGHSWRPFTTGLGDLLAQDVGTRFIVHRDGTGGTITLVEGKVVLLDGTGHTRLAELMPGFKTRWQLDTAQLSTTRADIELESAWRNGRLVFDETPLPQALERMELFSSAHFQIENGDLERLRVSGIFYGKDVPAFLRALEHVYGVKAIQDSPGRYVLRQ